jgi:hypothetical protein
MAPFFLNVRPAIPKGMVFLPDRQTWLTSTHAAWPNLDRRPQLDTRE